jgi:hypothetical protein
MFSNEHIALDLPLVFFARGGDLIHNRQRPDTFAVLKLNSRLIPRPFLEVFKCFHDQFTADNLGRI